MEIGLGSLVNFDKYLAKSTYCANKEVTQEFAKMYGLDFVESSSCINGFFIPRTKLKGFKLDTKRVGIVCGKRSLGADIYSDEGYCDGINKRIPVYLIANNLRGFYRVPEQWLELSQLINNI
jgi:hypothetical protein